MTSKYSLILFGALIGVFAAYCARSIRLAAWVWGGADVQGVVLIEGLLSDLTGSFSPAPFLIGTSHLFFGALVGLAVFAWPKHLLWACLVGLAGEITLLAVLTPIKSLPNTVLDPLGAIAIASFWLMLGIASYIAFRRFKSEPQHTVGNDSFSIHCNALS